MFWLRCLVLQGNVGCTTGTSDQAEEDKDKSHVEGNALGLVDGRRSAHFHFV